eukprot:CAMPEP_0170138446 /NCGR_PEP_ID=MMETSP0033_2-20121228/4923_1 /TAXON_ID=195969 /ORGANISM="Dolichomastix tenuilepis, Strain CCMP3274" /LENGTH=235 /DNA_ID=CAMNT_0010374453 /DNA_START=32 /DNA_END=735 /DNA_ORIENTATION=-
MERSGYVFGVEDSGVEDGERGDAVEVEELFALRVADALRRRPERLPRRVRVRLRRGCAHSDEELVPAGVCGELGVEGGGHEPPLPYRHDHLFEALRRLLLRRHVVLGEHLHVRAGGDDGGGADEEGAEGVVGGAQRRGRGEERLEAVDLAPEKVAVHLHVQTAQQVLPALLLTVSSRGEEDEPRTCSPDWPLRPRKRAERFHQTPSLGDERHSSGLAARDDEPRHVRELLRASNL